MGKIKILQQGVKNHLYLTDDDFNVLGVQKSLTFNDSCEQPTDKIEVTVTFVFKREDFTIYSESFERRMKSEEALLARKKKLQQANDTIKDFLEDKELDDLILNVSGEELKLAVERSKQD